MKPYRRRDSGGNDKATVSACRCLKTKNLETWGEDNAPDLDRRPRRRNVSPSSTDGGGRGTILAVTVYSILHHNILRERGLY